MVKVERSLYEHVCELLDDEEIGNTVRELELPIITELAAFVQWKCLRYDSLRTVEKTKAYRKLCKAEDIKLVHKLEDIIKFTSQRRTTCYIVTDDCDESENITKNTEVAIDICGVAYYMNLFPEDANMDYMILYKAFGMMLLQITSKYGSIEEIQDKIKLAAYIIVRVATKY